MGLWGFESTITELGNSLSAEKEKTKTLQDSNDELSKYSVEVETAFHSLHDRYGVLKNHARSREEEARALSSRVNNLEAEVESTRKIARDAEAAAEAARVRAEEERDAAAKKHAEAWKTAEELRNTLAERDAVVARLESEAEKGKVERTRLE